MVRPLAMQGTKWILIHRMQFSLLQAVYQPLLEFQTYTSSSFTRTHRPTKHGSGISVNRAGDSSSAPVVIIPNQLHRNMCRAARPARLRCHDGGECRDTRISANSCTEHDLDGHIRHPVPHFHGASIPRQDVGRAFSGGGRHIFPFSGFLSGLAQPIG